MEMTEAVQTDVAAIEAVVRGYFASFALRDETQLTQLVHPDLAKRHLVTQADGKRHIEQMSAAELVQISRQYGSGIAPTYREIIVLDVTGAIATAKGVTNEYVDYLHLVKLNDAWQIVNVLWQEN